MGRLSGKVAVVTGASRGIGLAIAESFAIEGCKVVITGRRDQALEETVDTLRGRGHTVTSQVCDVRDAASVRQLFASINTLYGKVELLVNNAGIAHAVTNVDQLEPEVWSEVIATNLTGMFLCTHYALPLIPEGGIIVNNLSVAVRSEFPGLAAYNASKKGAHGFTNTLREELRERRIRVIALIPGPTETDIWSQFWPDAPRSRMMSPDSVAAAVLTAVTLPENASVDEIVIAPAGGAL